MVVTVSTARIGFDQMEFVGNLSHCIRYMYDQHNDVECQNNKEGCKHVVWFHFDTRQQSVFTEEAKSQNQPDSQKKSKMPEYEAVLLD